MNNPKRSPFILHSQGGVNVEVVEPAKLQVWEPCLKYPFGILPIITRDEGHTWREHANGNGFRVKLTQLLCHEDLRFEIVRHFFEKTLKPGETFIQILIYLPGPLRVHSEDYPQATVWGELVIGHKNNFDRFGRLN